MWRLILACVLALWSCSDDASLPGGQSTAGAGAPSAGAPHTGAPSGSAPTAGTPSGSAPTGGTSSAGTPSAGGPSAGGPTAGTSSAGAPSTGTPAAGSPSAGAGAAAGGGGTAAPSGGPTFSRVWAEVLMLKGCAGEYCHGSGMGALPMKNKREAYDNLVNVAAKGAACAAGAKLRVKPMDADASLLLDKMSHAMPSCGDIMPIGAKLAPNCLSTTPSVCTTERELGLVRDWILAGARDD